MLQQNINTMNSSTNLPISSSNDNDLKQRGLSDRDTGDLDNITKQQLNDKATKIIAKGFDKSKEILKTIINIFKL